MRLGGPGGRRGRPRALPRPRGGLRRHRRQLLSDLQPAAQPGGAEKGRGAPGADPQRPRLRRHPALLQAQPAGAERGGADRLLDRPDGRPHGLPGAAGGGGRPRAGGRGLDRRAGPGGVPLPGGEHLLAGRPLPLLRRRGRRLGAGHGRRHRGAQAARRRPGGGGPGPRRDPRLGGQQRRRGQGGVHRPRRRGAGGGDRRGAADVRRRARLDRLRRGAWQRHHPGRSDRGRGPAPGLRAGRARRRPVRPGIDQEQRRPPQHRGGGRRADPRRARPGERHHPAHGRLRAPQSAGGFRTVLRAGEGHPLARGPLPPPRRGELVRPRRHQRPRRAGGCAGDRALGPLPPLAAPAALGAHRDGPGGPGRPSGGPAGGRRSGSGRRRLHPPGGTQAARPPPGSGLP